MIFLPWLGTQPRNLPAQHTLKLLIVGLAGFLSMTGYSQSNPVRGDVLAHDPSSIVKCGDEYWLFATGKGIISRHSKDLVNWVAGPSVFASSADAPSNAADGKPGYYWAPEVIALGDKYLLYYSISQWGKNTSSIRLAVNATLDQASPKFRWVDQGVVVESFATDKFNAIDPCIAREADGRLWLAFGSFWSGIKLIELDRSSGKRIAAESPMVSLAYNESIEAPAIFRHGEHYYLFVNWGLCCRGIKSTYNIRVGRSKTITGPYLDKSGVDMLKGGGSLFLDRAGSEIGPGHVGIYSDGRITLLSNHYYDANNRGKATLRVRPLSWGSDGWPIVSRETSE